MGLVNRNYPSHQLLAIRRSGRTMKHFAVGVFLTALLSLFLTGNATAQTSFTTLHTFTGNGDGLAPIGDLVADSQGVLYGVMQATGSGGKIFSLTPPAMNGGSWTHKVIYTGKSGPFALANAVILGPHGELYGTAQTCPGGFGCVFELTPPTTQGGNWIPKILHLFLGAAQGDGKGVAYGKLALDASGNLYGATQSGGLADTTTAGTVFELSPPTVVGGNWTETVLYKFQSTGKNAFYRPRIGVALGLHGELYGLAGAPRTSVFYQLKPPVRHGGTWTTTVINSQGAGGSSDLLVDSLGNLYANNVQLAPPTVPSGPWVWTLLPSISGSNAGVALGTRTTAFGTELYGTDFFGNAAYKLTPPSTQGGSWTLTVLHTFLGGSEGDQPLGPPTLDSSGNVFGTTLRGGTGPCRVTPQHPGCGTLWRLQ